MALPADTLYSALFFFIFCICIGLLCVCVCVCVCAAAEAQGDAALGGGALEEEVLVGLFCS